MPDPSPASSALAGGSPANGFVHLRVHTALSMSEGAIQVKALVKLCAKMAMPAVAITDSGNLFGALELSVTACDMGVQPIIGCQIAVRNEEVRERGFGAGRDLRAPDPDAVVLLAKNASGYANLMKIVSRSFIEGDGSEAPQVRLADIEALNDGLILLTGGVGGPLGRLLREGRRDEAAAILARHKEHFGDRVYVEIQRHGMADEDRIEADLIDLAYAQNVALVATNEPYYPDRAMFEAHDVLICMQQKTVIGDENRRRLTPEHYFKPANEMRALFADLPEAVDNTLVIAKRCAVMSEKRKPILPHSPAVKGRTEAEALCAMAEEGLDKRLEKHVYREGMSEAERIEIAKPYRERLAYELDVIIKMGFPGYFLIVADFIQWAKDADIPVGPGRGSGAGSCVAWALTITDLDPLRFSLLFERFLNPERVSMPDFDIDFCQDRREEVIRYVQREYGYERVAQIITFGKLQARAVLRSVGRVLQMPLGYVDKICKMVPNNPAAPVTLKEAIEAEPQLRDLQKNDEMVARLLDIGMKLEGLYSHASTHAAGVVIGDRPLDNLVALYRDPHSDMPVTQFNMKWVEQAGLVKFDFLGLKTLTVLQHAVRHIAKRGITVDLLDLPLDDRRSYDMLGRGETSGVFQLESTGMRDVLRNMKPDTLEDIVAIVALYRPGPMDNIPSYIKRKKGEEEVVYLHESLEPILKETYGILIYQEQVMQAAQIMAGYSLGGADLLRRAMGKKIKAEMDTQRALFVEGAGKRGTSEAKASEVFDQIAKFAGYGFNKSHAAAYGLVAYQTAYLKANYPVEFMAATMTYDMHNTDKLAVFKGELRRLDIPLLPPDVNRSFAVFGVEDGAVRYALGAVKNVGAAAMDALVAEREARGPFKDLADFARRLDGKVINKRLLENLIKAGALDSLDGDRAKLLANADVLMRHAQAAAEDRASNQSSLFGGAGATSEPPMKFRACAAWTITETLAHERDAMGFYLSAHPLDIYGDSLERLDVVPIEMLPGHLRGGGGGAVKLAVTPGARKERIGKSGSRYAFVELSDATGSCETMVFSEVLGASRELLDSGRPLLVRADARLEGEEVRLLAQAIELLDDAVARAARRIKVSFSDSGPIPRLAEIIRADGPGNRNILLVADLGDREVEFRLDGGFALRSETLAALRNVPGVGEVREV
ncbi:DNA polymerase III subunit alpha [Rhodospirillum rubrum]|uniref:DNA polymerase III subunit alpha n=1 Tax=Rhodospirillum rubrum TaxID=1085 RepID=UPI0019076370|nr:DNA polymerase III subunit alpha [Rhodospirillum rubrum]MBK1663298.1 DNA polymerase III subunit alpha [Rhodospirillum rubrum]MBK1675109.1 DNA polymerase III subunit alpha [Rhodospirillum rubrum]